LNRRDGGPVHHPTGSLHHHHHHHHQQSDSDMNAGVNDSEDDDDDSRGYPMPYDQVDYVNGTKVIVSGAGVKAINGIYTRSGSFDGVAKYQKNGIWKDKEETFSLFRCKLSDQSKRWYISIVPKNIQPGTNKDLDFYSAQGRNEFSEYPPEKWMTAMGEGIDPPPTLTWKRDVVPDVDEDPSDNGGRLVTGEGDDVIDDEAMGYL